MIDAVCPAPQPFVNELRVFIDEVVRERSSPAVESAFRSLLGVPVASGSGKKTRKGKANA